MTGAPIILLGAARSGTKFLRDCLAADPRTAVVPHDVNYIWRTGQQGFAHDRLSPDSLSPRTMDRIRGQLARQAGWDRGQRLLEKSVSNTLRVPFVETVYPDAIYVHLIRDGRDVVESAMRQWAQGPDRRALLKKLRTLPLSNLGYVWWYAGNMIRGKISGGRSGGAVWGPRYPGIDADALSKPLAEVCARQWRECVMTSRTDLGAITSARQFEIRYEDLVAAPDAICEIATGLGLDVDAVRAQWSATLRHPEADGRRRAWDGLPGADRDIVLDTIGPLLTELGYTE